MDQSHLNRYRRVRELYARHFETAGPEHIPQMSENFQRDFFDRVQRVLQASVLPGQTLLDIGCANGRFAAWAQALDLRYVGIDLMPEYVELARETLPSCDFLCADAADSATVRVVCKEVGRVDWLCCINVFGIVLDNPNLYRDFLKTWWGTVQAGVVMTFRHNPGGMKKNRNIATYDPEQLQASFGVYSRRMELMSWPRHDGSNNLIVIARK